MSFWAKVAGLFTGNTAEKTVDNLLDKDRGLLVRVGQYVNDLQLTAEEKLRYTMQNAEAVAEFVKSTLGESTERSKARRQIAVMIIRIEMALVLASAGMYPIDKDAAQFYLDLATSSLMMSITLAVIAFFFGGYYLRTSQTPPAPPLQSDKEPK
tara:strand:+ start:731 stop:1192 length:462 start_codon:yes stop_codon:yes gene_type:complete